MKKKLSVGLALGFILVILAGTAIALVFSDVFFRDASVLQEEKGDVNNWSLDDKIALIEALEESGIQIPQEQIQALRDDSVSPDTANRIADEILVEAKTARDALMDAYGFTNETFAFFDRTVSFSLGDDNHASLWTVTYTPKAYADPVGIYQVTVDAVTGSLIETSWTYDDIALENEPDNWHARVWNAALIDRLQAFPAQYEQRRAEMEQTYGAFDTWTLAEKALLDQVYTDTGYPADDIALNVLPDDGDISESEAVRQAITSLTEKYTVAAALLESWDRQISLYKLADSSEKLWVIAFLNPDRGINERYVVEMRSSSGTIELCARYLNELIVQPIPPEETQNTPAETDAANTQAHVLAAAWETMRSAYGFEDVTQQYLDSAIEQDIKQGTYTITYRSNNYNPRKVGEYTIVLDAETLNVLHTNWSLEEAYQNQGKANPWKNAELWSSYEYNQYAILRMNAKAIIEQAGDRWSLSFEQQAEYDALYRQAGYDPAQYFHGVPSALDVPLDEAVQIAYAAIRDQFRVKQDLLERAALTYEFDVSDETLCKWRFRVLVTTGDTETMYTVEIDSLSGEILKITAQPGSNG